MKQNEAPLSVVIPCFRCSGTIERAIESVFNQTLLPAECIVVDDCSDDDSYQRLNGLKKRYPSGWLRVFRLETNGGPSDARNFGWEQGRFEYIAFLDSDDAWHPEKVRLQYGWMKDNPDVAMTGHRIVTDAQNDIPQTSASVHAVSITRFRILRSSPFPTSSVMLRRDLPFRFVAGKRYCEDYALWLQTFFGGYRIAVLQLPLVFYYKPVYGSSGLSARMWEMEKGELDALYRVYRAKKLSAALLFPVSLYSLAKYGRRLFRVAVGNLKKGTLRPDKRRGNG